MNAHPLDDDDDEIFDDLHAGVTALHEMTQSRSVALSPKAVETLERLENSVATTRGKFLQWKQRLKGNAVKAAQKTDQAVHDHPWIFTIGALALGLLAGLAISSSDEEESSDL